MQWELPSRFGLVGHVHEEECDERFSMYCLKKAKNGVGIFFYVEKRMESKEVI